MLITTITFAVTSQVLYQAAQVCDCTCMYIYVWQQHVEQVNILDQVITTHKKHQSLGLTWQLKAWDRHCMLWCRISQQ